MAVTASDIKFYLSGGSSNSSGDASIGGAISSTEIPAYVMDGLMDQVSGKESKAGDTNYRIIYLKNNHATDDALNVELYFDQDATNKQRNDAGVLISPAVDDPIVYNSEITMALYPGNVNVAATALANEATAPAGSIVYSSAQGEPNALSNRNHTCHAIQGNYTQKNNPRKHSCKGHQSYFGFGHCRFQGINGKN